MIDLTKHLLQVKDLDVWFQRGVRDFGHGIRGLNCHEAERQWQEYREANGFKGHPSLLTAGSHNAKLNKAKVPTVGLTLQHYVQRVSESLVVNACPFAGDCTKVCVLDNGNGKFEKVQYARRNKTAFLAEHPKAFAYLLGRDLARELRRNGGEMLFRPNVNSDLRWDLILPSMVDGTQLPGMISYGYTKDPFILDTDGWVTPFYRIAYSWNEKSDPIAVGLFLERGGSVAVVTSRKKGEHPGRPFHLPGHPGGYFVNHYRVLDADKTDEWIFIEGAIGDLSAKGKARRLVGKSGFVVTI